MLEKWVKLLPYWLVMFLARKYGGADGIGMMKFGDNECGITYYELGPGEFVVYSQEQQDKYNERQKSNREKKRNKKLDNINEQLRGDYSLKKVLEEQFEYERRNNEY